jgi:hypothetical protein
VVVLIGEGLEEGVNERGSDVRIGV